ncbi:MAG: hypothetical protein EPO09_18130 [Aquabacterium sp.]|nr:MAG: hypothetical protein EPO09_18130 [Aquabacterium sp.]
MTDLSTTVFSNFVFAKKAYWLEWQKLAEAFFKYVEVDGHMDGSMKTSYLYAEKDTHMKTFIQERLASFILATHKFETVTFDRSASAEVHPQLFQDNYATRKTLSVCDFMKTKYRETSDEAYLEMYWKLRSQIPFTPIVM